MFAVLKKHKRLTLFGDSLLLFVIGYINCLGLLSDIRQYAAVNIQDMSINKI